MSQPTQRYDLSNLLEVVNNIDTTTPCECISSNNIENLIRHSSLCTSLKQEELKKEREPLSVNTGAGVSHKGFIAGTQPIRPPVSKFARTMWPDRDECSPEDIVMDDGEMNEGETKVIDFAFPAAKSPSNQRLRFANERERQLYYRPREWRKRRRGEWTDTGPRLCAQAE